MNQSKIKIQAPLSPYEDHRINRAQETMDDFTLGAATLILSWYDVLDKTAIDLALYNLVLKTWTLC